jgi:hypothetical protein
MSGGADAEAAAVSGGRQDMLEAANSSGDKAAAGANDLVGAREAGDEAATAKAADAAATEAGRKLQQRMQLTPAEAAKLAAVRYAAAPEPTESSSEWSSMEPESASATSSESPTTGNKLATKAAEMEAQREQDGSTTGWTRRPDGTWRKRGWASSGTSPAAGPDTKAVEAKEAAAEAENDAARAKADAVAAAAAKAQAQLAAKTAAAAAQAERKPDDAYRSSTLTEWGDGERDAAGSTENRNQATVASEQKHDPPEEPPVKQGRLASLRQMLGRYQHPEGIRGHI